jgi:threonine/homoserine/homoserine lactone efflux protein
MRQRNTLPREDQLPYKRRAGERLMPMSLYASFVLATAILMLIPGPNVSLIVANSIAYGTRCGLLTVAGTASASAVQLLLTVLGLTAVLDTMAGWFEWIRWAGVAYLLYLGVRQWRAKPVDLTQTRPQPRSLRALVLRGFLISLTNPKTLLFYSAFLPQFISSEAPVVPQVVLLAITYVVVAVTLDGAWAVAAGRARRLLGMRGRLRNRLTGGLLITAGLGLAAAHRR